ncbi:MAG: type IV pilin protein [Erysipelotrichaceae bacterium]
MKKMLKNKKGFTLVELIVVIAILGVLAVIMVPAFTGYVAKAKDASAKADVKSWCTAYQAAYAESQASTSVSITSALDGLGYKSDEYTIVGNVYTFTAQGSVAHTGTGNGANCTVAP